LAKNLVLSSRPIRRYQSECVADLPPALSLFIELQGTVLIVAMNLTFVTITEPIV